MPMYEYQCKKCGNHFEVEQKMTDDALSVHEDCGGDLVKVFSTAGIVLKGSGFYKTDTRSGSQKSSTKDSSSSSSTNSSSSSKSSGTAGNSSSSPS